MIAALPIALVAFGGVVVLAYAAVMLVGNEGMTQALALLAGLAVGAAMLLEPFLPLLLLVFFVPADALASRLFAPLPVSSSSALVLATLAGIVLNLPREARSRRLIPDGPVTRCTVAFALAAGLSFLFADHARLAEQSMSRIVGLIMIVLLVLRLADSFARIRAMVLTLVAATLFSSAVVIADTVFGVRFLSVQLAATTAEWNGIARSAGATDHNPTTAAIMLASGTLMAVVLALEYPRMRLLTVSTAVVGMAAIVLSFARSAAIAFAVTGLVLMWRHRSNRMFPLFCVIALAAGAAALPMVPDAYWERMGTLFNFDADYTLWRRLSYNLIGLDLLIENPLLGVGPGNFPFHYVDQEYRFFPGRTMFERDLHNMYLGVAAEYGLVGLIPFVAMLGSALAGLYRLMRRPGQDEAAQAFAGAILFAFVCFLIGSLFMPHQYNKLTWVLTGLAGAQIRLMRDSASGGPAARSG